ncbi:Werner Syndrome-like exonuclease, partial [Macadamia integrifolia]|uniref:Werner Syndrome-like exonuclease n=1 Tax=Macadamia integrifolia TaxID=60698 RepID=UPI001C501066
MTRQRVRFGGNSIETTVTDKASVVKDWVSNISSWYNGDRIVGLDCEWKANKSKEMNNKPATLQLCVNNKCIILQLFYMDYIPQSSKDFLNDPTFTFVGVDIDEDVEKLRNGYGLNCSSTTDLRELAREKWAGRWSHPLQPGLKVPAKEVVALSMEKPEALTWQSNWEDRELSQEQIEYACIDAYASYRIGEKMLMANGFSLWPLMKLLFVIFISYLVLSMLRARLLEASCFVTLLYIVLFSDTWQDS